MASNSNMQNNFGIAAGESKILTVGYIKNNITITALPGSVSADGVQSSGKTFGYHWHDTSVNNKVVWDNPNGPTATRQTTSGGCYTKAVYHMHSSSGNSESYTPNAGDTNPKSDSGGCFTNRHSYTVNHGHSFGSPDHWHANNVWGDGTAATGTPCSTCSRCGACSTDCGDTCYTTPHTEYTLSCSRSQSTPIGYDLSCGWSANSMVEAKYTFGSH